MRTLTILMLTTALLVAGEAGAQCATTTLSCSSTPANALTSADCASYDGSRYDLYQFNGTAGDTITIEMHTSAFDAYLGLINPSGVPVMDSDDLSTSSTDSKITITLNATGTWTIMANSVAASKTGDYNLLLSCASTTASGPRRRSTKKG